MSDAHESYWCYNCSKHVAVRTLDFLLLCCECNRATLYQEIPTAHLNGTEVSRPQGERSITSPVMVVSGGAPLPAAKSAVEALETFEVGSTSSEEGERLVCAVCKDAMVMGEKGKKLPCGHCYHDNCILPWLETRNSCPVCRFQLPTDGPQYERKRAREEPPSTIFICANSSSSRRARGEPPSTVFSGASTSSSGRRVRKTKATRYVAR